ncbi:MAG: F0F1 ATP synthase subunit delta [Actinomycetota bacterium]|nr:F0F1 ATP synthase subunit delta [Actinomycetota bacterium]
MIHAASRQALTTLESTLDTVTSRFSTADGLTGLAGELYQVVDLLVREPQLRRKLADPTTDAQRRADLAATLLGGKVVASTAQLVREAVALRWSSPWDLLDALEIVADEALFEAAVTAGVVDEVEDQLFRFGRVLDAQPRLSTLLDDATASSERRSALVHELLVDKVHPLTSALLEHAVTSQRKRSITHTIDDLLELGAKRRARSMARVVCAVELTREQQTRLAAALSDLYGRPISIRSAVDPAVRGGLVIRVGDEVIDGSIATRLASARATMAS